MPRWGAFAVVASAVFMSILDLLIVNIAFPELRRHFADTSVAGLSWVASGYAIVFAALLVPFGRLGDVLGRRRVFRAGLLVFVAGSAAAAAAPTVALLVGARLLQAVGAAALTPTSLALVLPLFPPDRRGRVIGAWASLGGIGAAAGPVAGGLLLGLGWQWIFLVNVPVGLAAVVLARRLPEIRDTQATLPDGWGAALLAAGVTALTLGLTQAPEWGWDARVWVSITAAALLIAGFAVRSARHRSPVIELSILRVRAFALASAASLTFFAGFGVSSLIGVTFLSEVWHFSASNAAFALAPGPVAAAVFAALAGRVSDRFGPARVGVPGTVLIATGSLWLIASLGPEPGYVAHYLPGQLLTGAGIGLMIPAFTAIASATLAPTSLSTGLGAIATFRQIGSALGIACWVALAGGPAIGAIAAADRGFWFIALCAGAAGLTLLPVALMPGEARPAQPGEARPG